MNENHSKIFFEGHTVNELSDDIRPVLIADRFSTPENIGHLIRLAANVGAKKIIVVDSEDHRQSKINKTAGTAIKYVDVVFCNLDELRDNIPADYSIVGLETAGGAENIYSAKLPDRMAIVLGSEKYGIQPDLLKMCGLKVFIPMPGPVKSMNVTHAAAVALFVWYSRRC
ncbi:MAG: TrmH family RNA methyltransferase [Chlorobi bacterium]|nr:TrmH family RNA methyltransferase [Chlorobiota bacterium]